MNLIIKPRNKNIYYRVSPPNNIIITSPIRLDDKKIYTILEKNIDRINRRLNKIVVKKSDVIHLLGKEYKLQLSKGNSEYVYLDDDNFYVFYKDEGNISKLIHEYYAQKLIMIIQRNKDTIEEKFNIKFKVNYKIKNTKTYFGKCFMKKRLIILSTLLAKYEEKYIISVLYHEFTHFYVYNHQKEFYDFIEKQYPNYKAVDKELKSIKYADLY